MLCGKATSTSSTDARQYNQETGGFNEGESKATATQDTPYLLRR